EVPTSTFAFCLLTFAFPRPVSGFRLLAPRRHALRVPGHDQQRRQPGRHFVDFTDAEPTQIVFLEFLGVGQRLDADLHRLYGNVSTSAKITPRPMKNQTQTSHHAPSQAVTSTSRAVQPHVIIPPLPLRPSPSKQSRP